MLVLYLRSLLFYDHVQGSLDSLLKVDLKVIQLLLKVVYVHFTVSDLHSGEIRLQVLELDEFRLVMHFMVYFMSILEKIRVF